MDGGRTAAAGKDGHGRPCRAVVAAQMGQVRAATFIQATLSGARQPHLRLRNRSLLHLTLMRIATPPAAAPLLTHTTD